MLWFRFRLRLGPAHGTFPRAYGWLLAVLVMGAPCAAQDDVSFERVSIDQGLSQSTVLSLMRDSRGFLWIGTQAGLNLYDGYGFRVFVSDPDVKESLSSDEVLALAEGRRGVIWVGTKNGLNRLDLASGAFSRVDEPDDSAGGDRSYVTALLATGTGELLVGTRTGLRRLGIGMPHLGRFDCTLDEGDDLADRAVAALLEDRDGNVWAGTSEGELCSVEMASGAVECFEVPEELRREAPGDGGLAWFSLYESLNGELLVGVSSSGPLVFDREARRFRSYSPQLDHVLADLGALVMSMAEDLRGDLWVATYGGGMVRLGSDLRTVRVYAGDEPAGCPNHLSDAYFTVLADPSGLVWAGSRDQGLIGIRADKLAHLSSQPASGVGLSRTVVLSVLEGRDGVLWVGFMDALDRLDPVAGARRTFTELDGDEGPLPLRNIFFIHELEEPGQLLVGGFPLGLLRVDVDLGRYRRLASTSLIGDATVDRHGAVWIAAMNDGLYRVDPSSGEQEHYQSDADVAGLSLQGRTVSTVREHTDGSLWIGTTRGLFRLDPDTRTARGYFADPRTPGALLDQEILWLLSSELTGLWIGTARGLHRYRPETGGFAAFTVKHGLPSNLIYSAVEDGHGQLWLGTNNGLCRFDPTSGVVRNYLRRQDPVVSL